MASVYPGTLDSFSTSHITGDTIEAAHVNDLADAANKIEAQLGRDHGKIVTSLPGSPVIGEEVVYKVSDDVALYLKYDTSISDAYKWRALGGEGWISRVETDETTASTTYANLATNGPDVTVPLAGIYIVRWGAQDYNGTLGSVNLMGVALGGTAANDTDSVRQRTDVVTSIDGYPMHPGLRVTLAASDLIRMRYRTTSGTAHFLGRHLAVTPIRVG